MALRPRKEEVAILRLFPDARVLSFIFPIRLSVIGAIPLTTTHSLAAKTIRDKRGEIVNNFPTYKHPTVFEAVDLSDEEKAVPIQKIMSSPMIVEGKVVGVIQISRKARPGEPVGPDFTQADLAQLATRGLRSGKVPFGIAGCFAGSPENLPRKLNMSDIRVRFAPSPTGYLHVGGRAQRFTTGFSPATWAEF